MWDSGPCQMSFGTYFSLSFQRIWLFSPVSVVRLPWPANVEILLERMALANTIKIYYENAMAT